jgi:hypothetical protein
MNRIIWSARATFGAAALALACPSMASAQRDSVTVAAGRRYQAGALGRWFLGGTYRGLWATPIRVPVLDWQRYAGGLHPTKEGGGMQTKSLRFEAANGAEYVFRLSDKSVNSGPEELKGTPVDGIFQDQVSSQHPAGAQIAAAIIEASGVLHPTAVLVVMPNDSSLGKYRKDFAGRLGMIEEYPNVPKPEPGFTGGFGGATKIIDSEELLRLLNTEPAQHVDARTFLAARLIDFLINDNDRHAGNWKWARLDSGSKTWTPIARDRDHAFVSYEGVLNGVARLTQRTLVSFGAAPNVAGLTVPGGFGARLLAGLEKPVWDSVAVALQARITDAVISRAAHAMPLEYQASAPQLEVVLKERRSALRDAADQFYRLLAARVQVHGTDAPDRAVIVRAGDGVVDVRLEAKGKPYFVRRFDARETSEILVYLHGGDDTAFVSGHVDRSILVRVIGGNGTNTLVDSSTVGGHRRPTRLYDSGTADSVSYGLDTLFERIPWERKDGVLAPPGPDVGGALQPLVGVTYERAIGFTPRVGVVRYRYGFAQRPYASMVKLESEYATKYQRARLSIAADQRLESSPLHFTVAGRMSDLEVVKFNGIGNATIDSGPATYFDVHQRQWRLHPAVALAFGSGMDVSLGPVVQHSVTDGAPNTYLSASHPYGVGSFTQAGLQLAATYMWREVRPEDEHARHTALIEIDGAYVPAALDVRSAFGRAAITMGTSVTLPLATQLVVRAGGKKVYGDFPFFEAATIGGMGTTRYMDTQRYAGDAALWGASELRIPVAHFQMVVPVSSGVLGLVEAGRVYDRGASPGGWHARTGEGIWFGLGDASPVVTLVRTTEPGHTGVHIGLGLHF